MRETGKRGERGGERDEVRGTDNERDRGGAGILWG